MNHHIIYGVIIEYNKTKYYSFIFIYMRFFTLLLFAFISQSPLLCQTDTTNVTFVAYWQPGDTFHFRITKILQTWQGRKQTQNDSIQYVAKFEVLHADTGSYTIRWSFKNTFFDIIDMSGASRKKFQKYDTTEVLYKTDKYGGFDKIENWQELSTMVTDLINGKINETKVDSIKVKLKKSMEPLLQVYRTERGIEQLVFRELLIFHFPFGYEYNKDKYYEYIEKLPNLLGGSPVTGNGILFVRSVDFDNHRCTLVQRMKILPDVADRILTTYFKSIGMRPEAVDEAITGSTLQIADNNIMDYHVLSGFAF